MNPPRILRNSLLNLLGTGGPLVVAIVAIPVLIAGLGTDRFGVLALVWVLIGYVGLLDLGIARALTKLVAERIGAPDEEEIGPLVVAALVVMLIVGMIAAVAVIALSPWFVRSLFTIPPQLEQECIRAFVLVGAALPAVTIVTALRGVLESYHRFDLVNAIRIPMGVLTFAGPLLVLPFSKALPWHVASLVAVRVAAALVHWQLVKRVVPALEPLPAFRTWLVKPLLRFGSWIAVSNLLSPVIVYLDRFVIGAALSVGAVTYYVTPFEIASKLLLIPGALLAVLFPAFATAFRQSAREASPLFGTAVLALLLILSPVVLVIVTFASTGLDLWLGEEFVRNSSVVLQWLAVGILINGLAHVPFTALHGAGRADLTGKLHLCEVPLYIAMLWWLTPRYGIEGVAIAWVIRAAVDALALFTIAARIVPGSAVWARRLSVAVPVTVAVIAGGALVPSTGLKTVYVAAILVVLIAAASARWSAAGARLRPAAGFPHEGA